MYVPMYTNSIIIIMIFLSYNNKICKMYIKYLELATILTSLDNRRSTVYCIIIPNDNI